MGKTFQQLVTENDQEVTLYIRSVVNIHDMERLDQIRLALLPYDLREVKRDGYKPVGTDSEAFGSWGGYPVFIVRAKLGLDITNERAEEKVALFTHIDKEQLITHHAGESPKKAEDDNSDDNEVDADRNYKTLGSTADNWSGTADKDRPAPAEPEMATGEAQKLAGQKRIDDFIKELEADRKEREKLVPDWDIYEAFCTSHIGLKTFHPNARLPRGFYVVEREVMSDKKESLLHIAGPFETAPDNYLFVPMMEKRGVEASEVLASSDSPVTLYVRTRGTDHHFLEDAHPYQTLHEAVHQEVKVTDTDTGKEYTAVVRGHTDTEARDLAVRTIADREDLSQERLVAAAPESGD